MATRNILVTGANKGIGKATVAAILGAQDDTFVFLGARDGGRGEAARADLCAQNAAWADRVVVVPLDVSDEASVQAAAAAVGERLGGERLCGLVNNAGIGFGDAAMRRVLEVNTWGPKRVIDAFAPLLADDGRVVNISSASGPMFVAGCSQANQAKLTSPAVTWSDVEAIMTNCLALHEGGGDFAASGWGSDNAYGLSKACLNAFTIALARERPGWVVNACTPGFIETDLTRPFAEAQGTTPEAMGMKAPEAGTKAAMHLLFGDVAGRGWYFGSDAVRSPLDRYRSPGDPPYVGD